MRDAFGGVFSSQLILVFIFLYVGFMAISFTYAKAFKYKNSIINYIEQNEGITLNEDKIVGAGSIDLYRVLNDFTCEKSAVSNEIASNVIANYSCSRGIMISEVEGKSPEYITYSVSVPANWSLGFFDILKSGTNNESGTWLIRGETNILVHE
jgi:hypothetical protein